MVTEGSSVDLYQMYWPSTSWRYGRARFDFLVRRAHTKLEPHLHEYDAQRLRSRRVLAQVPCSNAQL